MFACGAFGFLCSSRRDSPNRAQGKSMRAERALTRPWVELQAAKLQNVPQSPNGTVLISGVSRVLRVWPIGILFRAATLWLGNSPSLGTQGCGVARCARIAWPWVLIGPSLRDAGLRSSSVVCAFGLYCLQWSSTASGPLSNRQQKSNALMDPPGGVQCTMRKLMDRVECQPQNQG